MSGQGEGQHLIRRSEVANWLADSAIKVMTVHHTSAEHARTILERGVRIEQTASDAGWGQGFYSGTRSDRQYGESRIDVAVRLLRPWVVTDTLAAAEQIDDWLRRFETDDIGEAIQAAGFDGVIVQWDPEDLWVIAFSNEQIKVVADP
jgi:hypothetical protein